MQINIYRNTTNSLYTEGTLFIGETRVTSTLEASETMIPAGIYIVRIVKHSDRKQSIAIFRASHRTIRDKALSKIAMGHSWRDSKRARSIVIGTPLIPGVLHKASAIFERLTNRITKASQRGEDIILTIYEDSMTHHTPCQWWTEPPRHNCPPSRLRVETEQNGDITIHYPDGTSKRFVQEG